MLTCRRPRGVKRRFGTMRTLLLILRADAHLPSPAGKYDRRCKSQDLLHSALGNLNETSEAAART